MESSDWERTKLNPNIQIPNNLPRSGAIAFVGRDDLLERLHEQLQSNERIGITGIKGMGGIGKTELALQYAIYNQNIYPGGLCWIQARGQEIATQIISFAKANLGIKPPEDLDPDEKVRFTWQRWPEGDSLIILDDVTDHTAIKPYLPPPNPRFKVLITTRNNLGTSVAQIEIEALSDKAAIALLKSIIGNERIESQHPDVKALCRWVGNLPLGLELLGRFLVNKPDWTIAKLLQRLESKRLAAKVLVNSESGMTASRGIAAALELSWDELHEEDQDLACLLGMLSLAPIPWSLVEQCCEENDPEDLEDYRDNLRDRSLIKRVDKGTYQLHQIVQEFFREKLKARQEKAERIKSAFFNVMVQQAKRPDEGFTLEQLDDLQDTITHLEETAQHWLQHLNAEDKIAILWGITQYYKRLGNFGLAIIWQQKCLTTAKDLHGDTHQDVATCLNNLALLYDTQGLHQEAETLFLKALALTKQLWGEEHHHVASCLDNLAGVYMRQNRLEEAEHLLIQALTLTQKSLGNKHPHIASNLNNLAGLYRRQGRYQNAEPLLLQSLKINQMYFGNEDSRVARNLNNIAGLYIHQGRFKQAKTLLVQALKINQAFFGNEHPQTARGLNNLAGLYLKQNRFKEAEPLFIQSLNLTQKLYGEEHPQVASSLNNLAGLYEKQGRFKEAEPIYIKALKLSKQFYGEVHSDVSSTLNNLAGLYEKQGRFEEAEPLYKKALKLRIQVFGEAHPDVASSYFNLGVLYDKKGEFQTAKALYLPALNIRRQFFGERHPSTQALLSWFEKIPDEIEPISLEALGL